MIKLPNYELQKTVWGVRKILLLRRKKMYVVTRSTEVAAFKVSIPRMHDVGFYTPDSLKNGMLDSHRFENKNF